MDVELLRKHIHQINASAVAANKEAIIIACLQFGKFLRIQFPEHEFNDIPVQLKQHQQALDNINLPSLHDIEHLFEAVNQCWTTELNPPTRTFLRFVKVGLESYGYSFGERYREKSSEATLLEDEIGLFEKKLDVVQHKEQIWQEEDKQLAILLDKFDSVVKEIQNMVDLLLQQTTIQNSPTMGTTTLNDAEILGLTVKELNFHKEHLLQQLDIRQKSKNQNFKYVLTFTDACNQCLLDASTKMRTPSPTSTFSKLKLNVLLTIDKIYYFFTGKYHFNMNLNQESKVAEVEASINAFSSLFKPLQPKIADSYNHEQRRLLSNK